MSLFVYFDIGRFHCLPELYGCNTGRRFGVGLQFLAFHVKRRRRVTLCKKGHMRNDHDRLPIIALRRRRLATGTNDKFIRRCTTIIRGRRVIRCFIGIARLVNKGSGHLIIQRAQDRGFTRLTLSQGVRSVNELVRRRRKDVNNRHGARRSFLFLPRKRNSRVDVRVRLRRV